MNLYQQTTNIVCFSSRWTMSYFASSRKEHLVYTGSSAEQKKLAVLFFRIRWFLDLNIKIFFL